MESKNELKEIDIKSRACYYFEYIINGIDINFSDILLDEKLCMKIFQFMTFQTTLQRVQNHCVLGSIK